MRWHVFQTGIYYYQLAVKVITESVRETAAANEGNCQQLTVSSANRCILPFEIDFKRVHMASTDFPYSTAFYDYQQVVPIVFTASLCD